MVHWELEWYTGSWNGILGVEIVYWELEWYTGNGTLGVGMVHWELEWYTGSWNGIVGVETVSWWYNLNALSYISDAG